jgi:hypothetical protein
VQAQINHHLDNDAKRRSLAGITRVLRPGGRVALHAAAFMDVSVRALQHEGGIAYARAPVRREEQLPHQAVTLQ